VKRVEEDDARTFARATRLVGICVDDDPEEADDDDKGAVVDAKDPRRDAESDIVRGDGGGETKSLLTHSQASPSVPINDAVASFRCKDHVTLRNVFSDSKV
jgi:hypothetical protein